ncbi:MULTISPECIES: ROK family protein [Streptacidiphilus]|uniref:ROK family protein n=1 Tax=Streptacidiphilus cavernicola TaxID=3342716 RepID=A0ABV6UVJ0_9ACTN|nr:ROK family protein [Streptacidiphilus jeojiense]
MLEHTATRAPVEDELDVLRRWAAGPQPRALRAAIVLEAALGRHNAEIARRLGVSRQTVATWRQRYAAEGATGLDSRSQSGRPSVVDEGEVVAESLLAPPDQRSSRSLGRRLGCSHTAVAAARRHWNLGRDELSTPAPPLTPPLGEGGIWVVGLLHEPGHTLVLLAQRTGTRAEPAPADIQPPADALAAVTTAFTRALAAPAAPPAGPGTGQTAGHAAVGAFLAAARRVHPRAALHLVVLRGPAATDFTEQCARAKVTPHQPPEHTGTVSFLRAALALDAAQHPSSSARVLLDLAAALQGPAPLRWIREPLPAAPGERPSGAAGPLHAAGTASGAGANQIDLGSFNECVVIETVRLAGAITRGDIATRTRLTQQSVSRIARSLLERGLLVEDRKRPSADGKPRGLVRLRDDAAHAMGIHIDPEVLTAVVVDLSGRIVARRVERITPEPRPGAVVAQIAALGEAVLAGADRQVRESSFLGLGVAVPGPVDTVSGTVLDPPLMGVLRDVPLRTLLERRFSCPILIEKDSIAAAVGERWIGRDRRSRDFVYLYLGTGVGAGLILNGDIYRGLTANAGEFGQLCAVVLGRVEPSGRPEVLPECNPACHVLVPDPAAQRPQLTVRQAARAIGRGTLAVIDMLDVGLVVVGGPFCTGPAAEVYLTEIERAVNDFPTARRLRRVHVERSVSTHEAAAVGAASTLFHASFTPRLRRP